MNRRAPIKQILCFHLHQEISLPAGSKESQWIWLKEKSKNVRYVTKNLIPRVKWFLGVGNLDADLFLCGEAPGAEEEMQGEIIRWT